MIRSSAPTRIDLAGGTIDVSPISHALERPAVTVNLAIDLRAQVELTRTGDGFVEVISTDRGERVRLPADALRHDRLGLATRLIEWFGAADGLGVRTSCTAPPRSGLGGSSALAVALGGALAALHDAPFAPDVAKNVETAHLRLPTGYQDYYPAWYGGVLALTAAPGGIDVEKLADAGDFLARHLMLADTRIEHSSGMNNWEVVKRFCDGDADVGRSLNAINACASRMRAAVREGDLDGVAAALNDEWAELRRLAPVVSNRRIEAIVDAARHAGARAAKICGAGGGGCMVLVVEEAGDPAVASAIERAGGAVIDVRPDPDGLRVDEEPPAAPGAASAGTCRRA
ncbi:MAG: GHMP family kinase ATP-binding protein [Planctomycetota bacterium]|jgi:D-glycero-alpha-D-manno-heptose-7-phosphate kinase